MPWNFGKFCKHSIGFVVMCIETFMSVMQNRNVLFKLIKTLSVSNSFENITAKIRMIHCKYMKAEQTYF